MENNLTEDQLKIKKILEENLTEEEVNKYTHLSESIGVIYGLMFALQEEGILTQLTEENQENIKVSLTIMTDFAKLGLENDIGADKLDKVKASLEKGKLI